MNKTGTPHSERKRHNKCSVSGCENRGQRQNWANQLLSCHYGPANYQVVPDNDKGDAGIEGFTVSCGHAYQAYGCEEPLTTKARFIKQRTKMTDDVAKFIKNKSALSKIFGTVKITRWILFVPYFDSKEIVALRFPRFFAFQRPLVMQPHPWSAEL
ncbi:hypothetical protein [Paraburkholderia sp. A1RO-5L]|uniref:hypothetical protein n=1 Tax=unclassified Paraburkholderia TaxID=2615204 RepID=UPI003B812AE8